MKIRWLLDNVDAVRDAIAKNTLMVGTVDSWLLYVSIYLLKYFFRFCLKVCARLNKFMVAVNLIFFLIVKFLAISHTL